MVFCHSRLLMFGQFVVTDAILVASVPAEKDPLVDPPRASFWKVSDKMMGTVAWLQTIVGNRGKTMAIRDSVACSHVGRVANSRVRDTSMSQPLETYWCPRVISHALVTLTEDNRFHIEFCATYRPPD